MLECLYIALRRRGDPNVLPLVSGVLVYFWALSSSPKGAAYLNRFVQWELVASFVNALSDGLDHDIYINFLQCSTLSQTDDSPLPEDYFQRGQIYSTGLYPSTWFAKAPVDVDERFIEQSTFTKRRAFRIKWLAGRIAMLQQTVLLSPKAAIYSDSNKPIDNTAITDTGRQPGSIQPRWLHYDIKSDHFSVISQSSYNNNTTPPLISPTEPMSGIQAT